MNYDQEMQTLNLTLTTQSMSDQNKNIKQGRQTKNIINVKATPFDFSFEWYKFIG